MRFKKGETETKRGEITSLRSQSGRVTELGFEPAQFWLYSLCSIRWKISRQGTMTYYEAMKAIAINIKLMCRRHGAVFMDPGTSE